VLEFLLVSRGTSTQVMFVIRLVRGIPLDFLIQEEFMDHPEQHNDRGH